MNSRQKELRTRINAGSPVVYGEKGPLQED